jgi:hypothetical protein
MNEYEEINAKAVEYAGIDPKSPDDRERKLALRNEIWAFEYGLVSERNGRAHFPLLTGNNGKIDIDGFHNALLNVLVELFERFDPSRATFTTALKNRLNKRLIDAFNKQAETENNEQSNIAVVDGEEVDVFDTIPNEGLNIDERLTTEFEHYCRLAEIIAERKKQEEHLSKNKRGYFGGFFTFDTVRFAKGVAEGKRVIMKFSEEELSFQNNLLFPIMEIVVLEYLMEGSFTHMCDVAQNKLRDVKSLNKRNETMCACYGLSKPTVVKRNKAYMELLKAV